MHTSVYVCLNWSLYGNAIAVATRPIARNGGEPRYKPDTKWLRYVRGTLLCLLCHCLLSSFIDRIRPRVAFDSWLRAATDEKGNLREKLRESFTGRDGTGREGEGENYSTSR